MFLILKNYLRSALTNKYVVGAVLTIGLTMGAYFWHTAEVRSAVKLAITQTEQIYKDQLQAQKDKAKETEQKLYQESIDRMVEKDEQIKNLNSRVATLNRRLQERNRRTDNTNDSGTAGTCTGAELYREDGQFLAGEAARADRILAERDFYYHSYEAVRRKLNELRENQQ